MNFLATYIMRGRVQAVSVASSLALLSFLMPPVSIVSSATVALVTLRKGGIEGLRLIGFASLVAGLLGLLLLGNSPLALAYVLVLWLPIWFIAVILREGRQLALAIEIAVLLGVVAVIAAYAYNTDMATLWNGMFMQLMPENPPPDVAIDKFKENAARFAHYMTGVVAAGSVFSVLFGLFLARWWQANLYNPGGFKAEYLSLSTQPRLAIASLSIVAIAFISSGLLSEIAWNASILLFVLYSVVGSAVLHTQFSRMQLARYTVPMLYITLFLIPHALLLMAAIGILDAWLNLRKQKLN